MNLKYPLLIDNSYQSFQLGGNTSTLTQLEINTQNFGNILDYIRGVSLEDPLEHRVRLGGDFTGNSEIIIADYLNYQNITLGLQNVPGYVEPRLNIQSGIPERNVLTKLPPILRNVEYTEPLIDMTTELMSFENEITGEIRNLLRFTFANRLQETRDRGFNSLALRPVILCGRIDHSGDQSYADDLVPGPGVTRGVIHTADSDIESGGIDAESDLFLLSSNRRYNIHESQMSIYIPIVVDGLFINRPLESQPEPEQGDPATPIEEPDFSYNNYELTIDSIYNNNFVKVLRDCSNVILNTDTFSLENDITVLFKISERRVKIPFTQTITTNIYLLINNLVNEEIDFVTSEDSDELANISTYQLNGLVNLIIRERENYKALIIDSQLP